MQVAQVVFEDARFDSVVKGGLPEGGDLEFVLSEKRTVDGAPAVAITFTVELPDGTLARAQTVTTARLIATIGAMVRARLTFLGLEAEEPGAGPSKN